MGTAASKMNSNKMDADDIKAKLSVAAMATMAQAQGQEMTPEDQAIMMAQAKEQMKMQQPGFYAPPSGAEGEEDDGN